MSGVSGRGGIRAGHQHGFPADHRSDGGNCLRAGSSGPGRGGPRRRMGSGTGHRRQPLRLRPAMSGDRHRTRGAAGRGRGGTDAVHQLPAERRLRAGGLHPADAGHRQAHGLSPQEPDLRVHRKRGGRARPRRPHRGELQGDGVQDGHRRLRGRLFRTDAAGAVPAGHCQARYGAYPWDRLRSCSSRHCAKYRPHLRGDRRESARRGRGDGGRVGNPPRIRDHAAAGLRLRQARLREPGRCGVACGPGADRPSAPPVPASARRPCRSWRRRPAGGSAGWSSPPEARSRPRRGLRSSPSGWRG